MTTPRPPKKNLFKRLWICVRKKCLKKEKDIWFLTDEQIIKVDHKELEFIFTHAEKELKDSIDTAAITTSKISGLLTITMALLAALIGYSINRWDKVAEMDSFMITSLMGVSYLFIIAIILSFHILPRMYYPLGSDPKIFFDERLFHFSDKDMRLKMYYINEIESYRRRTNHNVEVNRERQVFYSFCYYCLIFTPVLLGVTFSLAKM